MQERQEAKFNSRFESLYAKFPNGWVVVDHKLELHPFPTLEEADDFVRTNFEWNDPILVRRISQPAAGVDFEKLVEKYATKTRAGGNALDRVKTSG